MSISEKIAKALNRGGPSVNHMFFKGKLGSFLAQIQGQVTSQGAMISQIVTSEIIDGETVYEANASFIISAINGQSSAKIKADLIEMTGKNIASFLKNIASGFTKHTHICYELDAEDVSDSVGTVVLDGEYDSVGGIFVLSDAGER